MRTCRRRLFQWKEGGRLGCAEQFLALLALDVGVEHKAIRPVAFSARTMRLLGMPSASTVESAMPVGSFGSLFVASSNQL